MNEENSPILKLDLKKKIWVIVRTDYFLLPRGTILFENQDNIYMAYCDKKVMYKFDLIQEKREETNHYPLLTFSHPGSSDCCIVDYTVVQMIDKGL